MYPRLAIFAHSTPRVPGVLPPSPTKRTRRRPDGAKDRLPIPVRASAPWAPTSRPDKTTRVPLEADRRGCPETVTLRCTAAATASRNVAPQRAAPVADRQI